MSSLLKQWRILGVPWVPLFVLLRAYVAGLVRAHECNRKCSGQRNLPSQNPRSATVKVYVLKLFLGSQASVALISKLPCVSLERYM